MEEDDVQLVQVFLCMSQQYDSPDLKRRTLKVPADRTRSLLVEPLGRPSAFSFKSFPLALPPPPPLFSLLAMDPPPKRPDAPRPGWSRHMEGSSSSQTAYTASCPRLQPESPMLH